MESMPIHCLASVYRTAEQLIHTSQRLSPRPAAAVTSIAIALGQLTARVCPDKLEAVLALVQKAHDASHPYDVHNTRLHKGRRHCKTCTVKRTQVWRARRAGVV